MNPHLTATFRHFLQLAAVALVATGILPGDSLDLVVGFALSAVSFIWYLIARWDRIVAMELYSLLLPVVRHGMHVGALVLIAGGWLLPGTEDTMIALGLSMTSMLWYAITGGDDPGTGPTGPLVVLLALILMLPSSGLAHPVTCMPTASFVTHLNTNTTVRQTQRGTLPHGGLMEIWEDPVSGAFYVVIVGRGASCTFIDGHGLAPHRPPVVSPRPTPRPGGRGAPT